MEELNNLCIEVLEQKLNAKCNTKFMVCNKYHNGKMYVGNIVEITTPSGRKIYKTFKNKNEVKKYYIEMLGM